MKYGECSFRSVFDIYFIESTVLWKTKISKNDRNIMNPKQKAMYLSK